MVSTNSTTTENISSQISTFVTITFSAISVISMSMLALFSYFMNNGKKILANGYDGLAVIGFTTLAMIVADLNNDEKNRTAEVAYHIYDFTMIIIIGILYHIHGAKKFFTTTNNSEDAMKPIGYNDLNISVLVLLITLVLAVLEILMLYGCFSKSRETFCLLEAILLLSGLVQKVAQALVYHFHLKERIPKQKKYLGASLYLKIAVLLNLFLWLESIIMAPMEEDTCGFVIGGTSGISSAVYTTLIIDYRLICFILYLEQSLYIDLYLYKKEKGKRCPESVIPSISATDDPQLKARKRQWFGFGWFLGSVFFALQWLSLLRYQNKINAWTNVFGIISDIAVSCGTMVLLHQISEVVDSARRKPIADEQIMSRAIDILVILMGTVGVFFWILKGSILLIWGYHEETDGFYYYWDGSKCIIRSVCVFFQILLFSRMSRIDTILRNQLRQKCRIHFVLPVITMSFLAVFINSIIDSYNADGEKRIKETKLTSVLRLAYESGHPIYLGFCLHMFIHFCTVIYYFRTGERPPTHSISTSRFASPVTSQLFTGRNETSQDEPLPAFEENLETPLLHDHGVFKES